MALCGVSQHNEDKIMSSFTDPLTVTKVKVGYKKFLIWKVPEYIWRVDRKFRYYVGDEDSNEYIDVQEGETTDFASVPRIFWVLYPPDGPYTQCAVLHDKLCRQKGLIYNDNGTLRQYYSSERAAEIFLESMEVLEVFKLDRIILYQAVLRFGPKWEF